MLVLCRSIRCGVEILELLQLLLVFDLLEEEVATRRALDVSVLGGWWGQLEQLLAGVTKEVEFL